MEKVRGCDLYKNDLSFKLPLSTSARLREENNRINNPSAYSRIRTKSPPPAPNDDDESIIDVPVQPTSYCAACRRRDSGRWWRAPKGLFTEMLCDSCGTNWRKYADLSARPIREENATLSKVRGEKREGTPINNANVKRPRVRTIKHLPHSFSQKSDCDLSRFRRYLSPPRLHRKPHHFRKERLLSAPVALINRSRPVSCYDASNVHSWFMQVWGI